MKLKTQPLINAKSHISSFFRVLLLLVCFNQALLGQGSLLLEKTSQSGCYYINRDSILCLVDSTSTLEYQDVLQPENLKRFQALSAVFKGYSWFHGKGISNQARYSFWTIARIRNPLPERQLYYYRSFEYRGDHAILYITRENGPPEIYETGFLTPFSKLSKEQQQLEQISREFKPVIPLELGPGECITIISQIRHYSTSNLLLVPTLSTRAYFLKSNEPVFSNQRKGFFLQGMLWMLFLFNFIVFLLNRVRAFLWLAGYNLCMVFVFSYLDGLNIFFQEQPIFNYYALTLAVAATPGFYSAFIFEFLHIPKTLPRLIPVFKFGMWSSLCAFFLSLLYFAVSTYWEFWDQIIYYFTLIPLALLVVFVFYALRQKKKMFYFFLVGNGFLFCGAMLYFLYSSPTGLGSLFRHSFSDLRIGNIFQFAIVAEMLTFAAGLGYQMLQTEKEKTRLEAVNEVKGRLYTNITHEFRTPLTIIMGMLEQIKGHDKERQLISRNSKNLLRLINQLLDLSKIDSGKMAFNWVKGDVVQYVKYLSESFASMAAEKDIDFQFTAAQPSIEMDFDEIKLQHIIYNLISNALKFTPTGGTVEINVSKMESAGLPYLKIDVQDNGIGIAREQLPFIFDRFFQAGKGVVKKGEGTGIGLTLTRELVELLDGELQVESEIGQGSTFSVLLPIHRRAKQLYQPQVNAKLSSMQAMVDVDERSEQLANDPNRAQLLLIEDNDDVAHFIQSLLQDQYQIMRAADGQQGIDIALENIPDIIISDVMMPEKDGFEVCEILKQDVRTSHIPIILLTAKAEQSDKVTGLRQGADAYLMKPFDKEELLVRLEKLLELRKTLQTRYAQFSPEAPVEEPSLEDQFLLQLRKAAEQVMDDPENAIAKLEQAMLLSQMQLYRKLKALTGQTPSLFIRDVRLEKAKTLLQNSDMSVSEIAYEVGFTSPAYFSRAFTEKYGHPPSELRN